jgi:carboxylesterase type B
MSPQPEPINADGVHATHEAQSYGSHPQNLFDIWLAPSPKPTPLVIFIHGGGFERGERSKIYEDPAIPRFLDAGVSFATIDYRYHDDPASPRGMRDSLCDCKRALQFMRSKAGEWNIDKTRVGAYGGSGGGGASLWLAFHDDMADPYNHDKVLRESTRLTVVGAKQVQATYDILRWPEVLGRTLTPVEAQGLYEEARELVRLDTVAALHSCEGIAIRQDLDFLQMMSRDDPPMYVANKLRKSLHDDKHHPLHAYALWRRAREVGLEVRAYAPWIGLSAPCEDLVDFFLWHLLNKPHLCKK